MKTIKYLSPFLFAFFMLFSGCDEVANTDQDNSDESSVSDDISSVNDDMSDGGNSDDQNSSSSTKNSNTITFGAFLLDKPDNWDVSENSMEGIEFSILAPFEGEEDLFRENSNGITEETMGMDWDEYIKLNLEGVENGLKSAKIIDSGEMTSESGVEMDFFIYRHTYSGYDIQVKTLMWLENGLAHILTFSAEEDNFDNYLDNFDAIANTVRR